jgi:hypothetical protein
VDGRIDVPGYHTATECLWEDNRRRPSSETYHIVTSVNAIDFQGTLMLVMVVVMVMTTMTVSRLYCVFSTWATLLNVAQ